MRDSNHPRIPSLLFKILRWVSLLPGAILGGWVAYLAMRIPLMLLREDSLLVLLYHDVISHFMFGFGSIYSGYFIAPSHKKQASVPLIAIGLLVLGTGLGITFTKAALLNIPLLQFPLLQPLTESIAMIAGLVIASVRVLTLSDRIKRIPGHSFQSRFALMKDSAFAERFAALKRRFPDFPRLALYIGKGRNWLWRQAGVSALLDHGHNVRFSLPRLKQRSAAAQDLKKANGKPPPSLVVKRKSEQTVFRDGFQVPKLKIAIPDTINLDPETKRKVTICNLFINHGLPVRDIVPMLDEDYRHVVRVLLNSGMVGERRQNGLEPPEGIERRSIN